MSNRDVSRSDMHTSRRLVAAALLVIGIGSAAILINNEIRRAASNERKIVVDIILGCDSSIDALMYSRVNLSAGVMHDIVVGETLYEHMNCWLFERGSRVTVLYEDDVYMQKLVRSGNDKVPYWIQSRAIEER